MGRDAEDDIQERQLTPPSIKIVDPAQMSLDIWAGSVSFGDVIPSIPAQMSCLIKIYRDDGIQNLSKAPKLRLFRLIVFPLYIRLLITKEHTTIKYTHQN